MRQSLRVHCPTSKESAAKFAAGRLGGPTTKEGFTIFRMGQAVKHMDSALLACPNPYPPYPVQAVPCTVDLAPAGRQLGIRLDADTWSRLERAAAERGQSPTGYARAAIVSRLSGDALEQLQGEVAQLRTEVEQLRARN